MSINFLEHAVVDTIVPRTSGAGFEELLSSAVQASKENEATLLPSVPQRTLLFFDELVPVYLVLRLTNCSEDVLKDQLSRLDILVEAYASSGVEEAAGVDVKQQQARDLIYSCTVTDKEDPLIVVDEIDGENGTLKHIYVIWKADVLLSRPNLRLQQPLVTFNALVSLDASGLQETDDVYLPTRVPASSNVFQSLSEQPGQRDYRNIFLPASRLLRVAPTTLESQGWTVQQQNHRPYPVVPVANARVRYSRVNAVSVRPVTIASVDFEVTPYTPYDVVLEKAELTVPDGSAECTLTTPSFVPPVACRPRDDVTFIYKLTPVEDSYETFTSSTGSVSTLDISLSATVLVSDECRAQVTMQWRTTVDFSMPLNPNFGAPGKFLQRTKRPSNLSVSTVQPGSRPGSAPNNRKSHPITESGISVSFSGPDYVEVGKEFHWDVFIVNKAAKPRRFAIAAIMKRKKGDWRKNNAGRPSSSSSSAGLRGESIAEAVTDDNFVYAMQKNAIPFETELLCLNNDVRAGPLPPGTSHLTRLKLLPLAPGPLQVESVRLVDMNSNDSVEIKDLPEIIALPAKAESEEITV